MINTIKNKVFQEERSLYNLHDSFIDKCTFSGPLDGESPLKECTNIIVANSHFDLRYPMWHINTLLINKTTLSELCRAALWYCSNVQITDSFLHGIKAVRECNNVQVNNCDILSKEFGWFTHNIELNSTKFEGEYAFLKSTEIKINDVDFKGKYSFQYVNNLQINNSILDTKDAFWHANNVVVKDSIVKGEYLAWYSNNLTFINCKIIGTQPLCYCKNLKLIDCEMIDCDLSFEKSEVEATIINEIDSIKNPLNGTIKVKGVKEIIIDDENSQGKIIIE